MGFELELVIRATVGNHEPKNKLRQESNSSQIHTSQTPFWVICFRVRATLVPSKLSLAWHTKTTQNPQTGFQNLL